MVVNILSQILIIVYFKLVKFVPFVVVQFVLVLIVGRKTDEMYDMLLILTLFDL